MKKKIKDLNKTIDDLNNQIRNERNKIKNLNKENELLRKQLKEKKDEYNNIINENNRLNNLIKEQQKLFERQKNISTNINYSGDKDLIEELNKKIEELELKLSRYPCDLSEDEELISVIITSPDKKILQSIICKNTENFSRLEDILFKEAPYYNDSNVYFCVKGNIVNRLKTLKENNIHNSDIIILNKREF